MFSPCILVVNNDVKLLVNLEAELNQAGYRVLTARDRWQGIYLAQAARPEVIVCDAKSSRSELSKTLARDAQTASIPFVCLSKSIDSHELVARVNAAIRSQVLC